MFVKTEPSVNAIDWDGDDALLIFAMVVIYN